LNALDKKSQKIYRPKDQNKLETAHLLLRNCFNFRSKNNNHYSKDKKIDLRSSATFLSGRIYREKCNELIAYSMKNYSKQTDLFENV